MLLLLHKTLKGSQNIQGFALIRVVLLHFVMFLNEILSELILIEFLTEIIDEWIQIL